MDTLSNISDTSYEIPLREADQTALRPALLHDLGAMPFESGALISRSLWVIFIGEWGVWTHAVLPVDDRLDMPDKESISGLCALVGSLMSPPLCHDDEKAMIVLRRRPDVLLLAQEPGANLCHYRLHGFDRRMEYSPRHR
jgi:hypothetical protein